ncbi:MAG: glucuronate isomerase [Eubacteriales bacterium]|nr:glucuronate isomerase [Eubacteriales bacterium]
MFYTVDSQKFAKRIYESVTSLPIIDFHNHLNVEDIAKNRKYDNITQMWLSCDPYKHRIMRILGVPEKLITGDSDDEEKFRAFCSVFPDAVGTPVYDFALLELKKIFSCDIIPSEETCDMLWKLTNEYLSENGVASILEKFNIEYSSPCASITDDLSLFGKNGLYPSLRADNLILPQKNLIEQLEERTHTKISSLAAYLGVLDRLISDFHAVGCLFADHAIDSDTPYISVGKTSTEDVEKLYVSQINGKLLSKTDKSVLSSYILFRLGEIYAKYKMVMQLHIGAERYTSDRLRKLTGPAGGYATIGNSTDTDSLTSIISDLENGEYGLPRIILYNLNPADNAKIATLSGSYCIDGVRGSVVAGAAWWWNDHRYGITEVLENVMAYSALSVFPGMVTDSRSVASFVRHDCFRRVLSEFLAEKSASGNLPKSEEALKSLARKMCYENAKSYIIR